MLRPGILPPEVGGHRLTLRWSVCRSVGRQDSNTSATTTTTTTTTIGTLTTATAGVNSSSSSSNTAAAPAVKIREGVADSE
ncbi:hypothetical protein HZH68_016607 [Vespula germanica]|uniref:Uncharacterized protein n=1 Tax=Vespula germanica TaxID=30212 RepID=A0A834J0K3_VESGE|nr:hypothetical protein HZH68_016607 [Vespula germanica]